MKKLLAVMVVLVVTAIASQGVFALSWSSDSASLMKAVGASDDNVFYLGSDNYMYEWSIASGSTQLGAVGGTGLHGFDVTPGGRIFLVRSSDHNVYYSSNNGSSFSAISSSSSGGEVAGSDTGYVIASQYTSSGLWVSDNFGVNWTHKNPDAITYTEVSMSTDGQYQVAASYTSGAPILLSTNYGQNFTQIATATGDVGGIDISNDGQTILYVSATGTNIYKLTSSNWTVTSVSSDGNGWAWSLVCDDTCEEVLVTSYSAPVYYSDDFGASWTQELSSGNYQGADMNAGGYYVGEIDTSVHYSEIIPPVTPPNVTNFDGDTTNFSIGSDNVSQPVLEMSSYGKIVWDGSNLDFSANDFDTYITMGAGWISVDSVNLGTDVNSSAVVTLYGNYEYPVVYRDGVECTDCVLSSSNSTHQVFTVPHFTNYSIENLTGCQVLGTQNRTYVLQNDITVTEDECFNVTAADITFDMNGYTITNTFDGTESKVFNVVLAAADRFSVVNGSYYLNSTGATVDGYFVFAQDVFDLTVEDIDVDYDMSKTDAGHQFIRNYQTLSTQHNMWVRRINGNMPAGTVIYRIQADDAYRTGGELRDINITSATPGYLYRIPNGFRTGVSFYNVITTNLSIYLRGRSCGSCSGTGAGYIYDSYIDGDVTFRQANGGQVINTEITGFLSHGNDGYGSSLKLVNSTILGAVTKEGPGDVYNNYFGGTLTLNGVSTLNTTQQNGTRPNSLSGTEIGGNYYSVDSQYCPDADRNYFCDIPLNVSGSIDYLAYTVLSEVMLVSPGHNAVVTDVTDDFVVNVATNASCSLYIDSVEVAVFNATTGNNSVDVSSVLISLNDGDVYDWNVSCNGNVSATWDLTVVDVNYPVFVDACKNLTFSAEYHLTQNIIVPISTVCFDIQADNVTFDFNGYSMSGVWSSTAVSVTNHVNTTINNAKTTGGMEAQLACSGVADIHVNHANMTDPVGRSLQLTGCSNSEIRDSFMYQMTSTGHGSGLIIDNVTGVVMGLSNSIIMTNSEFSSWTNLLDNSVYVGNVISCWQGVYVGTTVDNTVMYNNNFSQTCSDSNAGSIVGGTATLNTTKTLGTNVIGGSYIGGNWWADNDGCIDVDREGICDESYVWKNLTDNLPLRTLRDLFSGATNVTSPEQNDAVRGENVSVTVTLADIDYERVVIGTGTPVIGFSYELNTTRTSNSDRWGQCFYAEGDLFVDAQWGRNINVKNAPTDFGAFTMYEGCTVTGTPYATRTSSTDLRANPIDLVKGQLYTLYNDGVFSFIWRHFRAEMSPEELEPFEAEECAFNTGVKYCTTLMSFYLETVDHNVVDGGNETSYVVPVSVGDEVLSVGSYDVSGQGATNWTEIDLRVSNLGVIVGLAADKGVYWILNEDPQVSWSLTGADGYGALTSDVYLMNGSTVVASILNVQGEVSELDPAYDSGASTVYARANTFIAQGDVLTHIDNVATTNGCVLYYIIYEGTDPNSPGVYVGTVNASQSVGVCLVNGGALVDIVDVPGFVKGQSYMMFASYDGVATQIPRGYWTGYIDSIPEVVGWRYRNSVWESYFELTAKMVFVDQLNYNVSFNESVTTSYEIAHFQVDVTDTLFNETDDTTIVVADAMTAPLVTGPSTEQNGDFNVTWSASVENLGVTNYMVQQSLDGGVFTLVNTTTDTYYQITGDFEGDVVYQVKATDDYINTTYDNGTEFAIVLSPQMSSQVCALTYPHEDNLPTIAELPVNFSVFAPLGFTSPSVEIRLKLGGDTYSSTDCSYVEIDSTHREYSCNVSMNYWYGAGDYDLNITFTDLPKIVTVEYSGECAYGQLVASKQTVSAVAFSGAGPGILNTVSNVPVTIRNTGNAALDLKMTAYDLSGRTNPSIKLPATAFKAGASLGTSVVMANTVQENLSMVIEPSSGAEDDIWLWLSMPVGQLIQDYYSEIPWQVVGTG